MPTHSRPSHPHPHADPRTFWEGHYAEHRERMRGNPNALATEHTADLAPGTALELGCGQGADAIRLALAGWDVLAVDLADAALELGRGRAADAGVAGRITWRRHDLADGVPGGAYDLVLASYLQSPVRFARVDVLQAAADRVAPGGTLLVIGHAGPPSWADPGAGAHVDMPSAAELVAALDLPAAEWRADVQADVRREVTDPDGRPGTRPDSVVRLRRAA